MNSDEERLEEMLRAVMENDNTAKPNQNDETPASDMNDETPASDVMDGMPAFDMPAEMSASDMMDEMLNDMSDSDLIDDVLSDIPDSHLPYDVSKTTEPDIGGIFDSNMPDDALDIPASDMPGDVPEIPASDMPGDVPEIPDSDMLGDVPDIPASDMMGNMPEIPDADLPDISDFDVMNDMSDKMPGSLSAIEAEGIPESLMDMEEGKMSEAASGRKKDDVEVDPLALLDMSEEEIDRVLGGEAGGDTAASGKVVPKRKEEEEFPDPLNAGDALSDIQDLLSMSDNHEMVADEAIKEDMPFGSDVDLDSDDVRDLLGLTGEEDSAEGREETSPQEKKTEKEEKGRGKKKKEKKEKKEGFGKKLITLFFGADDELDEETEAAPKKEEKTENNKKKEAAKAGKKKKDNKKKPDKKDAPDPKKAAKEKQKKEKNAEKARKKAEKAEKAQKERRGAKKLPKKKVFVWILFCASIGAGILLVNTIGMDTLHLTEARNAFYDKDFERVYQLMNGQNLKEEDQLLFMQSSAILHLKHAEEAYNNHLKMEKPVTALEDLMKGVDKYQEIVQTGEPEVITPELIEEYQNILKILEEKYSLSEEGAWEINALKSDYEYSLQLEALANGEVYLSQSEIERQEEEEAEEEAEYSDLEDLLPEEEEYLNDSSN